MIYNDGSTSTLYYYVLNAQGDVIALLNSAGALVASYNYGAWGNYSVHDKDGKKNTSTSFIGHINPLRYRGYYYDRETRLYYLQSRYYDFANLPVHQCGCICYDECRELSELQYVRVLWKQPG